MTLQSPLHDRHRAAGAKFAEFAGWSMPLEYSGTVAEHTGVREAVGVFDVSHLGTLVARGPVPVLNTVLSNDLQRIGTGQAQYTLLLNDAGGVVDDLIVYRVADDEFLLVPNAANCARVAATLTEAGLAVENVHEATAIIAVQGPGSDAILPFGDLDYMAFRATQFAGVQCTVCRTGYTGERGVEILVAAQDAGAVWDALVAAGAVPCGLGARDTLRTEMGYALHGHELAADVPARWSSVSWAVVPGKGDFLGRQAYVDTEPDQKIVGLLVTGRGIPRAGMEVLRGDERVGTTTSGTFSPTLAQGIALARVVRDVSPGDEVQIAVRGRNVPARVVVLPFVPARVRG